MRGNIIALFVLLGIAFTSSDSVFARQEYAVKEKLDCVSCHVTPWGGGPRNVFGKAYGTHNLGAAKTAGSDLYYGDVRSILYIPTERIRNRQNGFAMMQAAATANVTLSDEGQDLRSLVTFNMAPLPGSQLREAYLRWRPGGDQPDPTFLIIGNFYVPFGYLIDEHRAYTRLQTHMTLNDYDTGVALSWGMAPGLRSELALVSNFQGNAGFNSNEFRFGSVANIRWNPQSLPFLIGASANYERSTRERDPYAVALYGGLSLDKISSMSGSVFVESVVAKNWNNPAFNAGGVNPPLPSFFIPQGSPELLAAVLTDTSAGFLGEARWNLGSRWVLKYRFDYLALNASRMGDGYLRNGFGFESRLGPQVLLDLRFEVANVPEGISEDSDVLAAHNDVFAMLRFWL